MKKNADMISRESVENCMLDTMRLRAALMIACLEMTDGDLEEAWDLAEHYYDLAPTLIEGLTEEGLSNLPGGPAQILPFQKKPKTDN